MTVMKRTRLGNNVEQKVPLSSEVMPFVRMFLIVADPAVFATPKLH